jgi:hypothetical protein
VAEVLGEAKVGAAMAAAVRGVAMVEVREAAGRAVVGTVAAKEVEVMVVAWVVRVVVRATRTERCTFSS